MVRRGDSGGLTFAGAKMIKVRLYTSEGSNVAEVYVLPFTEPPMVLMWGSRIFVYRFSTGTPSFYEAFCTVGYDAEQMRNIGLALMCEDGE